MIVPPIVETALFALVALALVGSSAISSRAFIFCCGFVVPLMFPRLSVGIGIDWYKIVGPLGLLLLVMSRLRGRRAFMTRLPEMNAFIIYAVVVTSVWMVIEYNWLQRYRLAAALSMGGGEAQTVYKMPVQLGSYVGQLLCAYVVPAWATTSREARSGLWGVIAGCAASVVAGLVSTAAYGVGTLNMTLERALFVVGDADFTRLGGMSGEPKFLGASLATIVALALSALLFGSRKYLRTATVVLGFSVVSLFLTFSTSAWAAALGALGVGLVWALLRWRESRIGTAVAIIAVGLFAMMSVAVVGSIIEQRFAERLFGVNAEIAGQKDVYVLEVFRDSPWNSIFGYGLGGGDLAIAPYAEWLHVKYGRTPTPGVTVMRLWVDLGIVGLVGLVAVALTWARRLRRLGEPGGAAFAVMGLSAALLSSIISSSTYFYAAGALLAWAELRVRENAREDAFSEREAPPIRLSALGRAA